MKRNLLREKLNKDEATYGTHVLVPSATHIESVGRSGKFDYAEFVAEYTQYTLPDLDNLARAAELYDLSLVIKVHQTGEGLTSQCAVGAGFEGVLFTDIRGPEDVERCYRFIRPETPTDQGQNGVKLLRATLGGYNPEPYIKWLNDIVFMIMIEKKSAVDQLDDIMAVSKSLGVDMVQWGPSDYSVSIGKDSGSPETKAAEEKVIKACLDHDIIPRIEIGTADAAKRYVDMGLRHFCAGWDVFQLLDWWTKLGSALREVVEPK